MSDETKEVKPGPKTTIKDVDARVDDLHQKLDKVVDSTNQAISGLQADFSKSVESILKAIDSQNAAKNNPVSLNQTPDLDIPNPTMSMEDDGEGLIVVGNKDLSDPDFRKELETKQAMKAFMDEPVTFQVNPTSEKDAAKFFQVGVNGTQKILWRGQQYTLPRCFIEVLGRAMVSTYGNEQYQKSDGEHAVRWPVSRGSRYPISIVHDTPQGIKWYQNLLREESARVH